MKHLIVKALITGMLLTSAGQVSAFTNEYDSCITTESWISNDQCYGKYTNNGHNSKCHKVRFTPELVQFSGFAIQQQIHYSDPVILDAHQSFTFSVRYRGHGACTARIRGAGPG